MRPQSFTPTTLHHPSFFTVHIYPSHHSQFSEHIAHIPTVLIIHIYTPRLSPHPTYTQPHSLPPTHPPLLAHHTPFLLPSHTCTTPSPSLYKAIGSPSLAPHKVPTPKHGSSVKHSALCRDKGCNLPLLST
ncbi:hypothetical protein FKM82_008538 [Ascaphus truei]